MPRRWSVAQPLSPSRPTAAGCQGRSRRLGGWLGGRVFLAHAGEQVTQRRVGACAAGEMGKSKAGVIGSRFQCVIGKGWTMRVA